MTTATENRNHPSWSDVISRTNQPHECDGCHETYPTLADVFSHTCPGEYNGRSAAITETARSLPANGAGSQRGAASPVKTNRYGGKCDLCGQWVDAEAGQLVKVAGKFGARHLDGACPEERPASVHPARTERPAPVTVDDGFYVNGNVVYKVQVAVHGSGQPYAKVLDADTGRFEYAPGAVRHLATGLADGSVERLTLERASELGSLYGMCMVCGRTLTDERSIANGIGPVCAGRL